MNGKVQRNLRRGDEEVSKSISTGNLFYQTFLTRKQRLLEALQ